jgi:hypothetical protein
MKNIIAIFVVLLIVISYITMILWQSGNIKLPSGAQTVSSEKCDAISCKNMDPVSDPKYNMQQIVKQSILLEEHLANKNKRCRDCITKHFLHIIGLAEEAQMLATNKIDKYPLINECVELYNRLFKRWLANYGVDGDYCSLYCCDELRNMRKKLIAVYFFNDP